MAAVERIVDGKKRHPVVMPERWGLADIKRNDHIVDAEVGTTIDDILDPAYWAHLAPEFHAFDTIEVRGEDGAWIAYLRVIFAERNYAKVVMERPVFYIEQNREIANDSRKHHIEWKGPHNKFAVIRNSDEQMVQSTFKTREEATTWMIDHEKTVRLPTEAI